MTGCYQSNHSTFFLVEDLVKKGWIHGHKSLLEGPKALQRCDRPADGRTDGWTDGQTDRQMDERMDGLTDGRTDGRTDVQGN